MQKITVNPHPENTVSDADNVIAVRSLDVDRLSAIYDLDVREQGDIVYHVVDGHLRAIAEQWNRPSRTRESWDRRIAEWTQMLPRSIRSSLPRSRTTST